MPDMYSNKIRERVEADVSGDVAKFLVEQKKRIVKQAIMNEPVDWAKENDELYRILAPKLNKITMDVAISSMEGLPGGIDIADVSRFSLDWVRRYFEELKKINDKTERVVRSAVADYFNTTGMTRGDLEEQLVNSGLFSPVRASRIAVTETTRAYAQAEHIIGDEYRKLGIQMEDIWNTDNDDLVCEICAPLNDQPRGEAWQEDPPAHVNCRCTISHRVKRG